MSTTTEVREWWEITVGGGYGTFPFFGTEAEAEEMRVHKARWEGAIARKHRAPTSMPPTPAPQGAEGEG